MRKGKGMKILKRNNGSPFTIRVTCAYKKDGYGFSYGEKADYCGSELEAEKNDIKRHPWYKYPEITGVDYGVICPVCGMFVTIPGKDIPAYVKDNAGEVSLEKGRLDGFEPKRDKDGRYL